MNNTKIIRILSKLLEIPQNEIKRLQKISMGILKKVLDDGYGFTILGFGTFSITLREKRESFNLVKLIFV